MQQLLQSGGDCKPKMSSCVVLTVVVFAVLSGLPNFSSCTPNPQELDPCLLGQQCNQSCCNALQQQVEILTRHVEELLNLSVPRDFPDDGSGDVIGDDNKDFPDDGSGDVIGDDNKVEGSWTSWGSWGSCSRTCGDGTKTRTRTCTNPTRAHGRAHCSGDSRQSQYCRTRSCPDLSAMKYQCRSDHGCGRHGYGYYWCWKASDSWDYCCDPFHFCGRHGYSYYWCDSGSSWAYCSP